MTFLVTGSTGLIGNNVVRLLLGRQQAVRVLVREASSRRSLEGLPVEVYTGDIRDRSDVKRAMAGVQNVVHSAAVLQVGHTKLDLSRAINVQGTRNVAREARSVGARMVHVSTVDTLGVGQSDRLASEEQQFGEKIPSSYSISKREAEQKVRDEIANGLDAVVVHPVFTIGPWDWKPSSGRMLLAVARQFTPFAPSGGHTVADARDVAEGILSACERGESGEHYILGGHPMSYFDYWKLCAHVSGGRPPLFRLGSLNRMIAGSCGDIWSRISGREGDVNSATLGLSSQWHYYSCEKAEQQLDYRCRPVRESLEASWAWLREYGYVAATRQ
jgi:dihydroflavonol-4-reductase